MLEDPVYWPGDVPKHCQMCGKQIVTLFVDGRATHPGQPERWMKLHRLCFERNGVGTFGPDQGQLYMKQADGRWLKIAG